MAIILGIETSCDETSASVLEGSGDEVALPEGKSPVKTTCPTPGITLADEQPSPARETES